MTDCFRCGDSDHLSYDCPTHMRQAPAPAPRPPAAPGRPENKPIPAPVPPEQCAQYDTVSPRAEALRRQMGWTLSATEARELDSRAKAAEQAAESRAERARAGDGKLVISTAQVRLR